MISIADATKLLNAILPGYVASARTVLGAATYNALSQAAQDAIVDLVYNGAPMANVVKDIHGHDYAMAAWDLMNAKTNKGVVWAKVVGQRANDDLIALAWGHEAELVIYS